MNRSPLYAGLSVFALLHSGSLLPLVAGQAQEGNAGDTTDTAGANQSLQNGYFSYVSDMDSAESVRQAMETLSWASKGSSWMEGSTPEATEEQEPPQATLSSSSSSEQVALATEVVQPTPTPASITSSSPSHSNSHNNSLAIGLGVGIPLAVLSILSILGVLIYKKRRATRKDFEKRTANLRHMSQTDV